MEFTLNFLDLFGQAILMLLPFLGFFSLIVVTLGQVVGRIEGWSAFNAFYWSFITAFTVGYGDIRPVRKMSKVLTIIIAMVGIMFTGVVVAITVTAATQAFNDSIGAQIGVLCTQELQPQSN